MAGTYGDATHVGSFNVDKTGRIIGASDVAINFPAPYLDLLDSFLISIAGVPLVTIGGDFISVSV